MRTVNTSSRRPSSGECFRTPSSSTADMSCSIMKARKQMKNQALIQEVIGQIQQRFTPKLPDIKKVRFLLLWVVCATY